MNSYKNYDVNFGNKILTVHGDIILGKVSKIMPVVFY